MNMHREYATLWEPMNPICSFSWCLFLFLSFCFFSTGRINLVFDEFVSVSIYGLQSANWFIHSHRDGEKGKERYGESVRSIQQQMYQRKWVCSKMTQLCLSRSWVAVRFFCNCTLCALLMIGSPIPLSFSFCRFSFIHPKNVYGRFTSFSFWPSPIPCSMLFTQFLFFLSLSLSHIYKQTYSEKNNVDGDDP